MLPFTSQQRAASGREKGAPDGLTLCILYAKNGQSPLTVITDTRSHIANYEQDQKRVF